jgi:hypothetical protein
VQETDWYWQILRLIGEYGAIGWMPILTRIIL